MFLTSPHPEIDSSIHLIQKHYETISVFDMSFLALFNILIVKREGREAFLIERQDIAVV